MIYERVGAKLDKLVEKTNKFNVRWRPLEEYIKYYSDNKDLNEYISLMLSNKDRKLDLEKSYIATKGFSYFVVLSYCGEADPEIELIGVIHKNANIIKIPQYFIKYTINDLMKSIENYTEYKKGDYSWETTDLFEFLETFTSDNQES